MDERGRGESQSRSAFHTIYSDDGYSIPLRSRARKKYSSRTPLPLHPQRVTSSRTRKKGEKKTASTSARRFVVVCATCAPRRTSDEQNEKLTVRNVERWEHSRRRRRAARARYPGGCTNTSPRHFTMKTPTPAFFTLRRVRMGKNPAKANV